MKATAVYGFQMARISEVYLSTLSALMKPHGIERYFVPFLYLCENSGQVTQKDLAHALRRDKVSAMRMVNYFCSKGLLKRKQDCNDRRCQFLEVTPKAMTLLPKVREGIRQTDDLLLSSFSSEEKKTFRQGMDQLYSTLDTLPDPAFIVKAFKRKNE